MLKFILRHPNAVEPKKATSGSVGFDLVAVDVKETDMYIQYHTGIHVKFPEKTFGMLCARSSISNYDLILANGVGIIDTDYTGELLFRFKKTKENGKYYIEGDRVGQLIITPFIIIPNMEIIHYPEDIPYFDFPKAKNEKDTNDSPRQSGGFGSTGS